MGLLVAKPLTNVARPCTFLLLAGHLKSFKFLSLELVTGLLIIEQLQEGYELNEKSQKIHK